MIRDDSELLFAQEDLGIQDPMLNQQWHLINTDMKDIELNVTGLWSRGITGQGVKTAIIDDGLDLESDDLHDNFVSGPTELHIESLTCSILCSTLQDHTILTTIRNFPYPACRTICMGHDVLGRSQQ